MKTKPRREKEDIRNTYNLYGLGLSKPLSPFFLFILAGSKPVGGMKQLCGLPEGCGALLGCSTPHSLLPKSRYAAGASSAPTPGPARPVASNSLRRSRSRSSPSSDHGDAPFSHYSKPQSADIFPVTYDLSRQRKWDGDEGRKFVNRRGLSDTVAVSDLLGYVVVENCLSLGKRIQIFIG